MIFIETAFIVTAVTLVPFYIARTAGQQTMLLIVASVVFYVALHWAMTGLLFVSILIASFVSWALQRGWRYALTWAIGGIVLQLSILGFFKYKFLFLDRAGSFSSSNSVAEFLLLAPLPVGISFYTFHAISLVVDSLRGQVRATDLPRAPTKHLLDTALYLTFYPQLVAGPIVRAKQFLPQIRRKTLSDCDVVRAIEFVTIGCFLKLFVADNLHSHTFVLGMPDSWQYQSPISLLAAILGYSFQIFADFAGYSYFALGIAKLFGYDLIRNFNLPYLACSFSEFWRRWHISLSTWLRDYLYVPLGGNRRGRFRTLTNISIVMLLGGLWHGAEWKYLLWGGYHGAALIGERLLAMSVGSFPWAVSLSSPVVRRAGKMLAWFGVFTVVTLSWLFFSVPELGDVPRLAHKLVASPWRLTGEATSSILGVSMFALPAIALHLLRFEPAGEDLQGRRIPAFAVAVMALLAALYSGPSHEFIYFQF